MNYKHQQAHNAYGKHMAMMATSTEAKKVEYGIKRGEFILFMIFLSFLGAVALYVFFMTVWFIFSII